MADARRKECPRCKGTGLRQMAEDRTGPASKCQVCGGTGYVGAKYEEKTQKTDTEAYSRRLPVIKKGYHPERAHLDPEGGEGARTTNEKDDYKRCPDCYGHGSARGKVCTHCNGKRFVPVDDESVKKSLPTQYEPKTDDQKGAGVGKRLPSGQYQVGDKTYRKEEFGREPPKKRPVQKAADSTEKGKYVYPPPTREAQKEGLTGQGLVKYRPEEFGNEPPRKPPLQKKAGEHREDEEAADLVGNCPKCNSQNTAFGDGPTHAECRSCGHKFTKEEPIKEAAASQRYECPHCKGTGGRLGGDCQTCKGGGDLSKEHFQYVTSGRDDPKDGPRPHGELSVKKARESQEDIDRDTREEHQHDRPNPHRPDKREPGPARWFENGKMVKNPNYTQEEADVYNKAEDAKKIKKGSGMKCPHCKRDIPGEPIKEAADSGYKPDKDTLESEWTGRPTGEKGKSPQYPPESKKPEGVVPKPNPMKDRLRYRALKPLPFERTMEEATHEARENYRGPKF